MTEHMENCVDYGIPVALTDVLTFGLEVGLRAVHTKMIYIWSLL